MPGQRSCEQGAGCSCRGRNRPIRVETGWAAKRTVSAIAKSSHCDIDDQFGWRKFLILVGCLAERGLEGVCRACPTAWRCKSSTHPDGGEGLAKRMSLPSRKRGPRPGPARRALKEAWSKIAARCGRNPSWSRPSRHERRVKPETRWGSARNPHARRRIREVDDGGCHHGGRRG